MNAVEAFRLHLLIQAARYPNLSWRDVETAFHNALEDVRAMRMEDEAGAGPGVGGPPAPEPGVTVAWPPAEVLT